MTATLKTQSQPVEAAWRALNSARARSVAIVSAEGGEGVSMLAEAIARRAVVSSGKPVLLVDLSDETPPPLLVDENKSERETAPEAIISQEVNIDDGITINANKIGILSRPDRTDPMWREPKLLNEQINEWLKEWSFVVFDTAPLLTREADAVPPTSVSAACDGCLMITLAGVTPANRVAEAKGLLDMAGARLFGAILNDRENPPLLGELERQTFKLQRFAPKVMANMRDWMRRSPVLGVTI